MLLLLKVLLHVQQLLDGVIHRSLRCLALLAAAASLLILEVLHGCVTLIFVRLQVLLLLQHLHDGR